MLPHTLPNPQEEAEEPALLMVMRNVVYEGLALRTRVRALAELLAAKGIVSPGELEERMRLIWHRDRAALIAELWERVLSAWESRPEEELCLECGAACCKSAVILLTPSEADALRRRAGELGVRGLEIYAISDQHLLGDDDPHSEPEWAMLAGPCVFLDRANRCRVYSDRPHHCANHPRYWREDCEISWRRYHRDTAIHRISPGSPPTDLAQRLTQGRSPSL